MKTNFRRRPRGVSTSTKRFLYVFIVLLLSISLISLFKSGVVSVFSHLWRGENFLSQVVRDSLESFRGNYSLARENRLLKENLTLVEQIGDNYEALVDLEEEILDIFGRRDYGRAIAASVLAHPPETPYDFLIIDVGTKEGVAVGDRVLAPKEGALGRVVETFDNQSRVLLYTSNKEETNAYLDRGDVSIKLIGLGGGGFEFFVPRDVAVEKGDKVVSADIKGELLGTVVMVELDTTDSEKRVLVGGVSNITNIRFVEVE